MVLHVGDISYANGDGEVWDSFMAAIEPASKRVPYMVAVGACRLSEEPWCCDRPVSSGLKATLRLQVGHGGPFPLRLLAILVTPGRIVFCEEGRL